MPARKKTVTAEIFEPKFSKSQLLAAKRFFDRRDLLNAILSDSETYTEKEVDTMIKAFMKGKVN